MVGALLWIFIQMYNFMIKEIEKPIDNKVLIENYRKILIIMSPFVPHFSNECLENFDQTTIEWPKISEDILFNENINFVVQINGKKRGILNTKRNTDEGTILKEIMQDMELKKLILEKKIIRKIFVPNRLINIIL